MKKYAVFVGMGFELLVVTFVAVWIGQLAEQKVPMRGLWLVACLVVSFCAWFYRVIVTLRKSEKVKREDKP